MCAKTIVLEIHGAIWGIIGILTIYLIFYQIKKRNLENFEDREN